MYENENEADDDSSPEADRLTADGSVDPRGSDTAETTAPANVASREVSPKMALAIFGATAAIMIVIVLFSSGGNDSATPDESPSFGGSDQDTEPDPVDLFGPSEDRPAVNPIRGCDLLTDDVLVAGLGSDSRGLDDVGSSKRGQGESCTAQLVPETSFFVSVEPGDPADFRADATVDGRVGVPVDDVGTTATWFPGSGDDGETALLAVHEVASVGDVVFRVAIGRPDVPPEDQLAHVSAAARELLQLFPGVEVEPPEPVDMVLDPEPAPPGTATFDDVLHDGVAASDWTLGEGLAEGLRAILGEPSTFKPPASVDAFSGSAAGLSLIAARYAEVGDDAAAREEVMDLLREFSTPEWTPPSEPPPPGDDSSGSDDEQALAPATHAASGRAAAGFVLAVNPPAQDSPDGTTNGPNDNCLFEDRSVYGEDTPTCRPACHWLYRAVATDPFCLEEIHGIRLYYPEALVEGAPIEGPWNGWTRDDLDGIRDGIVAAGQNYDFFGRVDNIVLHLSRYDDGLGVLFPSVDDPDRCEIFLTTPLQGLPRESQAFSVAIDVAGCVISNQLPDSVFDEAGAFLWWYRGLTTHFAAEALPESNLEWSGSLIDSLRRSELTSSLQTRPQNSSNWTFFRSAQLETGGPVGLFELVGPLSDAPSVQAQQDLLAAQPGIEELLQVAHVDLTEGLSGDASGAFYDAPSLAVPLAPYSRMKQSITRFGGARYHVTVPAGRYACFEDRSGDVMIWSRPGAPGIGSVGWDKALPQDLTDEGVIVVTTVHADQSFDALVRLFDEPGCDQEADEDDNTDVPEMCDFCDPSLYYRNPGTVDNAKSGSPDPGDESDDSDASEDGGAGSGDTGDGVGSSPPAQEPDDVRAWLSALCTSWQEFTEQTTLADGVDPTTLDLDARIDRAIRLTEELVTAADVLIDDLDDLDAPETYGPYQQRIVSRTEALSDDMTDYLDGSLETISDLSDMGSELQFGLAVIERESTRELEELAPADADLLRRVADQIPGCTELPR